MSKNQHDLEPTNVSGCFRWGCQKRQNEDDPNMNVEVAIVTPCRLWTCLRELAYLEITNLIIQRQHSRFYLAARRESKPEIVTGNMFVASVCKRTAKNITFKCIERQKTRKHVAKGCLEPESGLTSATQALKAEFRATDDAKKIGAAFDHKSPVYQQTALFNFSKSAKLEKQSSINPSAV